MESLRVPYLKFRSCTKLPTLEKTRLLYVEKRKTFTCKFFPTKTIFEEIRFPSILGKTHKESTCTFLNVISFLRCIEYRGTFPLMYKSQLILEHTKVFSESLPTFIFWFTLLFSIKTCLREI